MLKEADIHLIFTPHPLNVRLFSPPFPRPTSLTGIFMEMLILHYIFLKSNTSRLQISEEQNPKSKTERLVAYTWSCAPPSLDGTDPIGRTERSSNPCRYTCHLESQCCKLYIL